MALKKNEILGNKMEPRCLFCVKLGGNLRDLALAALRLGDFLCKMTATTKKSLNDWAIIASAAHW